VLDPEQNDTFSDHYFDDALRPVIGALHRHRQPCTTSPRPLRDRIEVIEIPGYTRDRKREIARRHLVPKVVREHGLTDAPPSIGDDAVRDVIRFWTREAGVRNLQRSLEMLARKVAREQVEAGDGDYRAPDLGAADLDRYLGPRKFLHDEGIDRDEVGVANGLAWTASGGEILVIEALRMKGKGKLIITGQLGEVMKESVQAAYSFVRSRAAHLGLNVDDIDDTDLHIHFPAGAVPKDGPSAGVTVTLALASLLSGLPVRADCAMTGEVTLRGKVLPVGGIKDKLLAAYRANIKHVILPKDNTKDLVELPEEVASAIEFHPISHVDELLAVALIGYRNRPRPPTADHAPPPPPSDVPSIDLTAPA
jgi:ATP-dependent Lon protease